MMLEWIDFCCDRHDNVCNQKYDDRHPYSFHLENVSREVSNFNRVLKEPIVAQYAAWGHDLIEDARMTYGDVKKKLYKLGALHCEEIAEVIYLCTDDKGRNRKQRKSDRHYEELESNETALFVKLCDVISNVKYSILTSNYSMAKLYLQEHDRYRRMVSPVMFGEIFAYMDRLFNLIR